MSRQGDTPPGGRARPGEVKPETVREVQEKYRLDDVTATTAEEAGAET